MLRGGEIIRWNSERYLALQQPSGYCLVQLSAISRFIIVWQICCQNIMIHNTLLAKKGCYTPIEDNKTNVDRTFVFPLGWNWHDMDPWLFPNEIRHYLGQTFNARSSGIVELRNNSIGGRSPQINLHTWINICIFFQKFFWLFEQCPVQPLWVLGMRCLHLQLNHVSKRDHWPRDSLPYDLPSHAWGTFPNRN